VHGRKRFSHRPRPDTQSLSWALFALLLVTFDTFVGSGLVRFQSHVPTVYLAQLDILLLRCWGMGAENDPRHELHAHPHLLLISAERPGNVVNGLYGEGLGECQWRGKCILRTGSRL
jgi:hypothetical protein